MKKSLSLAVALLFWLSGCTIKREVIQPVGYDFSTDILRVVPAQTIAKVRELGVQIYEGRTPPNVEGAYLMAPLYMTKSTVPNETVAPDGFNDYKLRVYNQNSKQLTAALDTKSVSKSTGNVSSTATGQGTYLSGRGNFFSLFVILEGKRTNNNTRSRTLEVYSGELTATGIRNLESTLFMLEDYGDPNNDLIPVDTGRAFKDNDGSSERITNFRLAAPGSGTTSQPEAGLWPLATMDGQ